MAVWWSVFCCDVATLLLQWVRRLGMFNVFFKLTLFLYWCAQVRTGKCCRRHRPALPRRPLAWWRWWDPTARWPSLITALTEVTGLLNFTSRTAGCPTANKLLLLSSNSNTRDLRLTWWVLEAGCPTVGCADTCRLLSTSRPFSAIWTDRWATVRRGSLAQPATSAEITTGALEDSLSLNIYKSCLFFFSYNLYCLMT